MRPIPLPELSGHKIFFSNGDCGDADEIPTVEHIEGDIHAPFYENHTRVFTSAPATARGIEHGRIATRVAGEVPRLLCDIDGVGESFVKDDAVSTARIAEPRDAIHTDSAVNEMRAAPDDDGGRIHDRLCGPRVGSRLENWIM